MKSNPIEQRSLILALSFLLCAPLLAQVPQIINYQGRIAVGMVNFEGTGQFKFALVNGNGSTTYWSNDGSSVAGSEPLAAVNLIVNKGLYSVLLGDTSLPNMALIPASVFNNADVRLRIWFNDGMSGSQLLAPDQRLAAVGYAITAGTVADGAVTASKIADGAVTAAKIPDGSITAAKLGFTLGIGGGILTEGREFITQGTHTFTVPAGVTKIMCEMWGGGGGGEDLGTGGMPGGTFGEPGRNGWYSRKTIPVTAGSVLTIVVGTGGAAGSVSAGQTGGNSMVKDSLNNILAYAGGGKGGGLATGVTPDPTAMINREGGIGPSMGAGSPAVNGTVEPFPGASRAGNGSVHDGFYFIAHASPGNGGYVFLQW